MRLPHHALSVPLKKEAELAREALPAFRGEGVGERLSLCQFAAVPFLPSGKPLRSKPRLSPLSLAEKELSDLLEAPSCAERDADGFQPQKARGEGRPSVFADCVSPCYFQVAICQSRGGFQKALRRGLGMHRGLRLTPDS